jgi:hypothetical protein
VLFLEDPFANYLFGRRAVALRHPLEGTRYAGGSAEQSLAVWILAQELELSPHELLEVGVAARFGKMFTGIVTNELRRHGDQPSAA